MHHYSCAVLTLFAAVASGSSPDRHSGADAGPAVVILLRDFADIPPVILRQAEDHVTRIFAEEGIEVRFEDARRPGEGEDADAHYVSAALRGTADPSGSGALGMARPFANGGTQLEIFYPPVQSVIQSRPESGGRILAHVIAHELGHLLTRVPDHKANGMMKRHFDNQDFRLMSWRYLAFDGWDLQAMRGTLMMWARQKAK
jgi:hypothetical protein